MTIIRRSVLGAVLIVAALSFAHPASALTPTISLFYDQLAPYGQWVQLSDYGWVWLPNAEGAGWRPYTHGHWAYVDDYGWTWVSAYPWGWAPFHYGRWDYDDNYGWFWVPGTEWAPAWVSWRVSDDYVGWAPLPPGAVWREDGIRHDRDDYDGRIRWNGWSFVRMRDFDDRDLSRVVGLAPRNISLLNQTRNITELSPWQGHIVNRSLGPDLDGHFKENPLPRYRLNDLKEPGPIEQRRGHLEIYRPIISTSHPEHMPARREEQREEGRRTPAPEASHGFTGGPWVNQFRNLQSQQEMERSQLRQLHEEEQALPPRGVNEEQLRRQHDIENQAQTYQHGLEMRQFFNREQRDEDLERGQGYGDMHGEGRGEAHGEGGGEGRGHGR